MSALRVVVIGAGIGGLAAALDLARQGVAVTLIEKEASTGGKMREIVVGGQPVASGPTVFTLRPLFEKLFDDLGESLAAHLTLRPLEILARHLWADGRSLDLHADLSQSADAVGRFAGAAAARGFTAFQADAARTWRTLERSFIHAEAPSLLRLIRTAGLAGLPALWRMRALRSLWSVLGEYFADPGLRQLFGRYATYCGASPFAAPATLMLVAHVEQQGVWQVEGGMQRLAEALTALALRRGVLLRCNEPVCSVEVQGGRVSGVRTAQGRIDADAVICNADPVAVASGLFGPSVLRALPRMQPSMRSLSAVTWSALVPTNQARLEHHTVLFSHDYAREFADIAAGRLPHEPTLYLCAQDRTCGGSPPTAAVERLLLLVNAPPWGDLGRPAPEEVASCTTGLHLQLERCGMRLALDSALSQVTTPAEFHRLFPGTGGALYGMASHGWRASFQRPAARTRISGFYLAGGGTHPGPGIPMALLSGRLAASCLLQDLDSRARSRTVATLGGTSMR
jgi:1-hydroxycarotenoid 3,4-desaturase